MRRKDREVTDPDEILQIIGKAKLLHLGLVDGDYPYVVPLHYGYEYLEDKRELVFFMHGASQGHKLELIKRNPNVCVELECDIALISGGDNPCQYSSSYASVMGKGRAELVEETREKIRGLKLLMKNQTGQDFEIDAKMAASAAVIKVCLSSFTAKANPKV